MGDLYVALFAGASGFVAAGILASFYQLVTATPARFDMGSDRLMAGVFQIILLMFAGPVILMRNAIRGRLVEKRHPGWFAASAGIVLAWSMCSGVVVLQFAFAVRDSIG